MQKLEFLSIIVTTSVAVASGCDDGVADTAENAGRCQQICNAVDECTGEDNSTDCRQDCTDRAEDDAFEERVEACSQCIERENDCEENARECSDECAGVVTLTAG